MILENHVLWLGKKKNKLSFYFYFFFFAMDYFKVRIIRLNNIISKVPRSNIWFYIIINDYYFNIINIIWYPCRGGSRSVLKLSLYLRLIYENNRKPNIILLLYISAEHEPIFHRFFWGRERALSSYPLPLASALVPMPMYTINITLSKNIDYKWYYST